MMRRVPHVLMLFLDGVGIGRDDPGINPFFAAPLPFIRRLLGGAMPRLGDASLDKPGVSVAAIDATLGIPGLPQSGTGQVALLTGANAPRTIGKHFGPFPYSTLKPLLRHENIFSRLDGLGRKGFYANAFPEIYFEHMRSRKGRMTAIPLAWTMSGRSLNDGAALAAGEALSADITNARWRSMGYPDMPVIGGSEAGRRLCSMTEKYDFVLYEFYLTDHAGHNRSMEEAVRVLGMLDDLIGGILASLDPESTLLVITSDHGNLEDLTTKSHTLNPVPLIAAGDASREFASGIKSLTDVAPAVVKVLTDAG